VLARVGGFVVPWRLKASGRDAVVAGRLDGHAVAAAWPIVTRDTGTTVDRHCLPAFAPDSWDVVRPWPTATTAAGEERSPSLALEVSSSGDSPAVIERVGRWRDVLLRPAADGVDRWSLAADAVFLLGDFPSGSRDSRHFGPVDRPALRNRVGGR
jgi:hypothetical protein